MPTLFVARMPWTLGLVAACCAFFAVAPVEAKKGGATRKPAAAPAPAGSSVFRVQVDKSHALDEHFMEIRMSRAPGKVQLTVKTEEGAIIADVQEDFTGKPANAPLVVRWDQAKDQPTGSIQLRMYDREEHYIDQEYSAWYVPIPHEEVNFRTDSADIDPPEVPKLDAAFGKIVEVLSKDKAREHKNLTLYIAGHTDTVGNNAYNLKLSQARAQSLARWFRQKGVRIPIAYEGFGETALRVQTPDQTDEPRNRRADYIIADDAPPMTGGTTFKPSWKRIN
jgi:outer membrane protein OmpA-like peptidoglycan-associated protein